MTIKVFRFLTLIAFFGLLGCTGKSLDGSSVEVFKKSVFEVVKDLPEKQRVLFIESVSALSKTKTKNEFGIPDLNTLSFFHGKNQDYILAEWGMLKKTHEEPIVVIDDIISNLNGQKIEVEKQIEKTVSLPVHRVLMTLRPKYWDASNLKKAINSELEHREKFFNPSMSNEDSIFDQGYSYDEMATMSIDNVRRKEELNDLIKEINAGDWDKLVDIDKESLMKLEMKLSSTESEITKNKKNKAELIARLALLQEPILGF